MTKGKAVTTELRTAQVQHKQDQQQIAVLQKQLEALQQTIEEQDTSTGEGGDVQDGRQNLPSPPQQRQSEVVEGLSAGVAIPHTPQTPQTPQAPANREVTALRAALAAERVASERKVHRLSNIA